MMCITELDEEFRKLLLEIKPLYMELDNRQDRSKVACLIRELNELSNTDFEKNQRNELAKSLLFRLKSKQLDSLSLNDIICGGDPKKKVSEKDVKNGTDNNYRYRRVNRTRVKTPTLKMKTSSDSKRNKRTNLHSGSTSTSRVRTTKNHVPYSFNSTGGFLLDEPKPNGQYNYSTMAESDEIEGTDTKSGEDSPNFEREWSTFLENESSEADETSSLDQPRHSEPNVFHCTNEGTQTPKKKEMQDLSVRWSNGPPQRKAKDVNSYKQRPSLPNIRATISRLQDKESAQKAQVIEAQFYEQLVDARRQNEIEVSKLVARKNAELLAVQQNAELKHKELRDAVSRLESQLAEAVSTADQTRRNSEEKMNNLQSTMVKKLEDIMGEASEQQANLIKEHEEEIRNMKDTQLQMEKQMENDKRQLLELQSQLDTEVKRSNSLMDSLKTMRDEYDETLKLVEMAERDKRSFKQEIAQLQLELEESRSKWQSLSNDYRKTIEDQSQQMARMKSEQTKKLTELETQHLETESKLRLTNEKLKREFADQLHNAQLDQEERLRREVQTAEARGKQIGQEAGDSEMRILRKNLTEQREKYAEMDNKYQEIINKLKVDLSQAQEQTRQNKIDFDNQRNLFLLQIAQLEKELSLATVKPNSSNPTAQSDKIDPIIERVSEKLTKQMSEWQNQFVEDAIQMARQEESRRLESLYKCKEDELKARFAVEMDRVKTDRDQKIEELQRSLELHRNETARLEAELNEAKRVAIKEVEIRRQQLAEISVARETERREWNREHSRKLAEEQRKSDELLKQLRQQQEEEMQTVSIKVSGKIQELERDYKNRLKELNKRLNESQNKIVDLDATLQTTIRERGQLQETLMQSQQEDLEKLKTKYEQEIAELKEAVASNQVRARLAETSLRQQEKMLSELKTKWQEEQLEKIGCSLPVGVQTHMEATIEALRLQVNLLRKRISLMEDEREAHTMNLPNQQITDRSPQFEKSNINLSKQLARHNNILPTGDDLQDELPGLENPSPRYSNPKQSNEYVDRNFKITSHSNEYSWTKI